MSNLLCKPLYYQHNKTIRSGRLKCISKYGLIPEFKPSKARKILSLWNDAILKLSHCVSLSLQADLSEVCQV